MIKHIERLWLYLTLFATLWILLPSNLFLNPTATIVNNETGEVIFTRKTPLGDVEARWRTEITLIGEGGRDGVECSSGSWRWQTYQSRRGDTIKYQIGEWAMPCLRAGPPYVMRTTRQVYLFGIIPLRSHTDAVTIEPRTFK